MTVTRDAIRQALVAEQIAWYDRCPLSHTYLRNDRPITEDESLAYSAGCLVTIRSVGARLGLSEQKVRDLQHEAAQLFVASLPRFEPQRGR